MAFLPRGYAFPNSFLYWLCFFSAQIAIWTVATTINKIAGEKSEIRFASRDLDSYTLDSRPSSQ